MYMYLLNTVQTYHTQKKNRIPKMFVGPNIFVRSRHSAYSVYAQIRACVYMPLSNSSTTPCICMYIVVNNRTAEVGVTMLYRSTKW